MTRCTRIFFLVLLVFSTSLAIAQDKHAARRSLRQMLLKRFDTDGDGVLSASERAAVAARRAGVGDSGTPQRMTWKVAGLDREAFVYLPTKPTARGAPVVFGFHGHGGTARNAARTFGIQKLWPEALVVYMQGVPTPGRLTDPDGKRNGWQHAAGVLDDRDLKFFDTVLTTLRGKQHIDESRIYATGHSNGGGFTYLLWCHRPDVFAAIAPSSASARSLWTTHPQPIPVMHLAGENDSLVKFKWQQRAMERVRAINGCVKEGTEWAKLCTLYASPTNHAPFIALIHPGTHKYCLDAPPLIVRFFKEHARKIPARTNSPDGS